MFILCFFPIAAFAQQFAEGKDYVLVSLPQEQTVKSPTPMIIEFFSYGCPWCYKIEAPLEKWIHAQNNQLKLEKIPVVFKPNWEVYAKAYYTAKALALQDKLNPLLFSAIQNKMHPILTNQSMIEFFTAHGVDKEIAASAFTHSPSIEMQVSQGMNLLAHYQIQAVPAFVVNYKYRTDLLMAGTPDRLFEILQYLLKLS